MQSKFTILVVHNHYKIRGGEDTVFESETAMLEKAGHRVVRLEVNNDALDEKTGLLGKLNMFLSTLWSRSGYRLVRDTIRREKPELVHFHNIFPRLSPAAFWAAKREGVPVVETLHNYRVTCLNGYLFRKGKVCEGCLGRSLWPGVLRGCYRGRLASAAVAAMHMLHRLLGTYRCKVDAYIALTDFGKQLFVRAGLPAEKVHVKPNVVWLPVLQHTTLAAPPKGRVFCASRLSSEKGVDILVKAWLQAWPRLQELTPRPELRIAGEGPERDSLEAAAKSCPSIHFLGSLPREVCIAETRASAFIVQPSICYETFGLVILEAASQGTPAIASKLGTFESLITDGKNGRLFPAGDAKALAQLLTALLTQPEQLEPMRAQAHAFFERQDFSPAKNLARLEALYSDLLQKDNKSRAC